MALDTLYSGEDYCLTPSNKSYCERDTVYFELVNNTDAPIIYGEKFLLDIKIGEKWYPVCPVEGVGGLTAITLAPNETVRLEINSKSLCTAKLYEYNEAIGEYEYSSNEERFGRDIYLISGHYRFMKDIGIENTGGVKDIFLACEFDIV